MAARQRGDVGVRSLGCNATYRPLNRWRGFPTDFGAYLFCGGSTVGIRRTVLLGDR